MVLPAPLLALLFFGLQFGFLLGADGDPERPLNDIRPNPDLEAFAPNGIDFLYINLNRSTHRRQHMEQQLHRAGIAATRWPATEIPLDSMDVTLGLRLTHGHPRPKSNHSRRHYAGTLGCRRSHTAAVAHLLASGEPGSWHMVFEDDVIFQPTLFKRAQHFMQYVPDNWDVIRFDCEGVLRAHPAFYDVVAPSVFRVHWGAKEDCASQPQLRCWLCAGAYVVLYRHEALPAVLQAVEDHVDDIDYDCVLTRAGQPYGPLNTYCIQLGQVNAWSASFPSDRLGH